ncbi:hypothetical protein PYW07_011940 [Mythimna separata]|uniref:Peptidase S1 domain-containing protein n=1 Tax=Mythimna separata TaxID=271217 RepID=A0AAD7YME4_MYTSE|nr:hypothetical protein PYW07_011940 [Mythimna separata]
MHSRNSNNTSSAMKYLLIVCALAALALAEELIALHYHESVGIPEAARIKQAELATDFDGSRIVGGAPAAVGTYPFLVGLVITLTTGGTSVCGSSMLSNTRALTAAHCWWDGRNQARSFTLVFGSARLFSGGTRVATSSVQMHAAYSPSTLNNDVAMISFRSVPYSNAVRAVALPSGALLSSNFAGAWAQAAGYGKTSDAAGISQNQFQSHVSLQVVTNAACAQFFGGIVVPSTLCTSGAGGAGTCGGDSGGPLAVSSGGARVLIGVTSFGSSRGCQVGFPSGFARVADERASGRRARRLPAGTAVLALLV